MLLVNVEYFLFIIAKIMFLTSRPNYAERIEVRYLSASFDTLIHLLHRAPNMKMGCNMRNKVTPY